MNRSFPAFSQKKNLFIQNYFGTFSPRCSGVNQAFVLWTFLAISRMPISFCSPSGRNDQSQMKLHNETRRLLADRTKLRANIITISEFPWKDCTHVVHRRSKWIVASRLDSSSLSSFLVDCFFHSPKQRFEKNNNKFTHTHTFQSLTKAFDFDFIHFIPLAFPIILPPFHRVPGQKEATNNSFQW